MALQNVDVAPGTSRRRRICLVALSAGALWGVLLPILGLTVPMYETETASSDGALVTGSDTLVGANGPGVLIVLLLPLTFAVVVGLLLLAVPAGSGGAGRRVAVAVAWTLTGLLGVLTVLGMLSIGIFLLPVTIALLVACANAPRT